MSESLTPRIMVRRNPRSFPLVAFAGVAAAVIVVSILAHAHLPPLHRGHRDLTGRSWYYAFSWWDGWWYDGIARHGYRFFSTERQSPVAFFPGYPLLLRLIGPKVGGALVAGFGVTLISGLGATALFHRWSIRMVGLEKARLAVWLLLLYPFAFYLMGAVYSDALFLFLTVGAFLSLENDRPFVAGLLAGAATATRPVGVAVVLGLWVLALERRGVVGSRGTSGSPSGGLRRRDAWLLLAPCGLLAYSTFLWIRFRRPLAFLEAGGARGWDQPPGFHTWFKVEWVTTMLHGPWSNGHFGHLLLNALATVTAVALVPRVFRRFGLGYGVFVFVAVVLTALSTKDFVGMGRYTLAAFPCFAAAADVLGHRRLLAGLTLAVFTVGLVLLTQLHARGTLVS